MSSAAGIFKKRSSGSRILTSFSQESIDNWVDTQDRPVDFGSIPLGTGELLPAGTLDGEKPDTQRVSEATGNEGGSYERAYHRVAIVLWHKSRYAEVLLQAAPAAIPYLEELLEAWSAADKPSRSSKAWREIATVAKNVIEAWGGTTHRGRIAARIRNVVGKEIEVPIPVVPVGRLRGVLPRSWTSSSSSLRPISRAG